MRKRIWFSAIGLLVVGLVLAGLLGVIDTLSGTPPLTVSQPSNSGSIPGDSGQKQQASLLKNISPELPDLPHTPLFEVSNAVATSLLRSTATLDYNGSLWNFQSSSSVENYTGGQIDPGITDYLKKTTSNVTVTPLQDFGSGTVALPTSLYPVSVDSSLPLSYLPEEQLFTSDQGLPESYSFQSVSYLFDNATLINAEVAQDDQYLQLPSDITERTRQLAENITAGIDSPYQQAQAIEIYLKDNYTFDYDYESAPAGQEPNDWFLFDEKKGVCTNFNSAFVTLSRAAGLPSRLVGGYAINPEADTQTVYADQAHAWSEVEFQDIGWQTFDATGDAPVPAATVTEITSVSSTVTKGNTFAVEGTVTSPGATVEGVLVELYINPQKSYTGGTKVGQGTVASGMFNIEADIPDNKTVGNYQLLAHALESTRYQESWSDPRIKVTAETRFNLDVPARIKIKDALTVKGTLEETTGNPVGGQSVKINIDKDPVAHVTTDQKGQFKWEEMFSAAGQYNLEMVFAGTEYYTGVSREAAIDVLLPTVITLQTPADTKADESITLTGHLMEETTQTPIQGQTISFLINNKQFDLITVTDERGDFSFQYTFAKAGIHQVKVVSDYTDQYWESSYTSAIEIIPVNRPFPWFYLILILAALGCGAGLYFLYKRTKSRELAAVGPVSAVPEPPVVPVVPESHIPEAVIKIRFPGITTPFPDVWGLNEELETDFELFDPFGHRVSGGILQIYVKDRNTILKTDEKGTARLFLTFSDKAVYNIEAVLAGTSGTGDVKSSRSIKIVDYREEIVELFKLLKTWFTEKGLSFPQEATPREILEIIVISKFNIPLEVLVRLINYFEEADYSLHPVSRENYLRMYLVQKDVREYVR